MGDSDSTLIYSSNDEDYEYNFSDEETKSSDDENKPSRKRSRSPEKIPPPPPKKNKNKDTNDEDKLPLRLIFLLDNAFKTPEIGSGNKPPKKNKKRKKFKPIKNEKKDEEKIEKKYVRIIREINSLNDLIELGKMYDEEKAKVERYNIDLYRLNQLIEPLTKLQNMIGFATAKKYLLEQIVYFLQDFETQNLDMMHTIIEGNPGVGKTTFAKILAEIFLKLGILENDTFILARRSDLIGGYLGQTAIKTQDMIDEAYGGVLFIDEIYALGHPDKRDSFSKECIDVLNQNLTENKNNFICIAAGYKEDNKNSFFSMNKGLERRFPWRIQLDDYKADELRLIFIKMVKDLEWGFLNKDDPKKTFFEKNKCYFKFNGGDMETLFQMCRIVHSRRVFCLDKEFKKKLTMEDLENALKLFINNDEIKNRKDGNLSKLIEQGLYL